MHIILTGATGSVGTGVLRLCLASPEITRLSILSRRDFPLPTGEGIEPGKAEIIVHDNFTQYPSSLLDKLKGAHGCIWAQGISQTQVAKDEYIRITYDYPLAAAKAFSTLSEDKFNFVHVSGEGADPTEKTYTLFGKIKGRAEVALRALPSTPEYSALRIFNVRPGGVLASSPEDQSAGTGLPRRFMLATVGPLLRAVMPSMVSPTKVLSKVLVDLAIGDGEPVPAGPGIEDDGHLVRCVGVRKLGNAGRWD
ncbi:hypothetical protein C8R46DRAFT_1091607 [Mycena filopes]|nr:hypothetical protein C8R46DRAFT_1091607 [Mycena filopes]